MMQLQNTGNRGLALGREGGWGPPVFFVAVPFGLWDLSSPTMDQTTDPCIGSTES